MGISCCLRGEAFGCLHQLRFQLQQAWCGIAVELEDFLKNGSAVPHHGESRVSRLLVVACYASARIWISQRQI